MILCWGKGVITQQNGKEKKADEFYLQFVLIYFNEQIVFLR